MGSIGLGACPRPISWATRAVPLTFTLPSNRTCACTHKGQQWRCMVRHDAKVGDVLHLPGPDASAIADIRLLVKDIVSEWEEEGEDFGVEASVEILPSSTTDTQTMMWFLNTFGYLSFSLFNCFLD